MGALNNPVLLITIGGITEFTLYEDGSIFLSYRWWEFKLASGVSIISFIPLDPECFGMRGDVFPEGLSDTRGKVKGDFGGVPGTLSPKGGANCFTFRGVRV